ncbi:adenosine deaminase 2-like [Aricia agestis]|uniref:adenosine deaminase 2-like n=1 Tax=Aricia agestis TaxID=91739 RepID=UPI001C203B21|nr:adenosine deaminase 2-like [Aricia agestis]
MVKMWPVLLCFLLVKSGVSDVFEDIVEERNRILHKELDMMLGADIILNDTEELANKIVMELKHKEVDFGFQNPQYFNYSKHFFDYKDEVKKSELFKIIRRMPKGAVLHAHDTGILSAEYVLNITYWDDLYVCFKSAGVQFLFAEDTPASPCETQWQVMKNARFSSGNVEKFDAELLKYFSIIIPNPLEVYTDVNTAWSKFQEYFIVTTALFSYKPVWEKYFYDTLKALREDNVMYFEVRSVLPHLYDLKGNHYDEIQTAGSYKDALDKFMMDYPDFYGAKLIYAPLRLVDAKTVNKYLKIAYELKKKYPDFVAGFDLVGQEDLGVPTKEVFKELVQARDKIDFFFHAGETNWCGTSSDENILDVILLGTKRIGHGFALIKHPVLMEEIKKRDIALEVNVVSNAVLKLVEDVRNHPLAAYIAQNLPVVLSSDDPGVWGADPLSHDFYVAFVGVASRHADLKLLKKLALNSLYYSTYPNKDKLVHEFEIRWTRFIHSVVDDHHKVIPSV